jgi:peptide chain release factor 2
MTAMEPFIRQAQSQAEEVELALEKLDIAGLETRQHELAGRMASADFWTDSARAQAESREHAKLSARITPWRQLETKMSDIVELASLKDESLLPELQDRLGKATKQFSELKNQLKLAGVFDDHDAILTIQAGAGGTDAQDWADMLRRMYVRYGEQRSYKVQQLDESAGEEAGIKSVTLAFEGPLAYGHLKSEHGVHRLVRQSPFNADGLRQTSFARVEILPKIDTPTEVVIDEKDLKTDVYRAGGKGGQSVNTTDSAVRLTHIPTGITVAIQNERSQLQNKETALTILRSKLAQLQLEQHQSEINALRGPNEQAAWGNQISNYVLHPYKLVKDLRTNFETSDTEAVLAGKLDGFINAYLEHVLGTA